tara:strand:+ start:342 stop:632 length:291 start_codon:yes stop_codon:yes gene_type:complete
MFMADKKNPVDKTTKGLTSLIDEFTSSIKELVNAGEETVIHLAVGGGRAISAVVDATGTVTKVAVETASNVVGAVGGGAYRAVKNLTKGNSEEEDE